MKLNAIDLLLVMTLFFSCNYENADTQSNPYIKEGDSIITSNQRVCFDSFCVFFYLPNGLTRRKRDTNYHANLIRIIEDSFMHADSSIGLIVAYSDYPQTESLSQELADMFDCLISPRKGNAYIGYLDTINAFPYIHIHERRQELNFQKDLIFSYFMKKQFSIEIFNSAYSLSDTTFYMNIRDSILNSITLQQRW